MKGIIEYGIKRVIERVEKKSRGGDRKEMSY
jgi:hypothetical protein